ncbi:UDP-N-acetylenolpyruvoylglucosamine reductase [Pectobacterium atrosepticum SCRI1043]|uniref:UDP-N-acetylenolpyruvoylglucosamine reductase n=1 Tax=Pectobacterium atrosepticum (strain SCRI 1043 / ATCC BAA-672) TaxID=218491 RepID=MURB_PECAS|nr:UDP-N-acetylmuramate dehydrogenase [Pectobacterium atrosepticum]Q6DAP0.1 RecName: Full=UDP-N-acetylenolpyruvoylglucosamine reductase; AltName: Full=UDP-N-acetylmuramate dehydrogenase [Pectobacterium atrosepticum SCRI1043]AIA69233.1 UDP-N-acetylenolpyruvoylglucosamine reductase [Pectobacterium atrosepticum]ATY92953.1 UDP-N-acetylenolpyruvoylglucosamine reductase [Pectobacterium atrosepticum]KFX10393.1 UDP-N-acetylenolpyruvoylglucosamine reductase [Pectobacterium atrosepticum]KFX19898.1 UDP-N
MAPSVISLRSHNSFSLSVSASCIKVADTQDKLIEEWRVASASQEPVLLLGEGSNVLFLEDFLGTILLNRLKGIDIREESDGWYLHVGAGENWHQLVEYTLKCGITGLENLALIPGCVGSAPIQNIGAYGIELQHVCDYVELLDLTEGKTIHLTTEECQFGYRESIFKHQYRYGFAITAVGIFLKKEWNPVLNYGDLAKLNPATVTPQQVFDSVCHMRRSKLPDPVVTGNAGSFFKNPIVTKQHADSILREYPNMPQYLQADGNVKLAAGWLIDQCKLKGFQLGGAAVHEQQALVLINKSNAKGSDIVELARYVRNQVAAKFSIQLEPEVRFIAAHGEVNAIEVLS